MERSTSGQPWKKKDSAIVFVQAISWIFSTIAGSLFGEFMSYTSKSLESDFAQPFVIISPLSDVHIFRTFGST